MKIISHINKEFLIKEIKNISERFKKLNKTRILFDEFILKKDELCKKYNIEITGFYSFQYLLDMLETINKKEEFALIYIYFLNFSKKHLDNYKIEDEGFDFNITKINE